MLERIQAGWLPSRARRLRRDRRAPHQRWRRRVRRRRKRRLRQRRRFELRWQVRLPTLYLGTPQDADLAERPGAVPERAATARSARAALPGAGVAVAGARAGLEAEAGAAGEEAAAAVEGAAVEEGLKRIAGKWVSSAFLAHLFASQELCT